LVSKGKKWLSLKKTSHAKKRETAKLKIQQAVMKMQENN